MANHLNQAVRSKAREQRPRTFRILETRKQERAGGSQATSPTLIAPNATKLNYFSSTVAPASSKVFLAEAGATVELK